MKIKTQFMNVVMLETCSANFYIYNEVLYFSSGTLQEDKI